VPAFDFLSQDFGRYVPNIITLDFNGATLIVKARYRSAGDKFCEGAETPSTPRTTPNVPL